MEQFVELVRYATSGFCVFFGCLLLLAVLASAVCNITSTVFRALAVLFRGWPGSKNSTKQEIKEISEMIKSAFEPTLN